MKKQNMQPSIAAHEKKKFFSGGLYLEGIRQTRIIGILSIILITFVAVITPIGGAIIQMAEEAQHVGNDTYVITPETVTGLVMNPILFLVFVITAPTMVISLFGFMNKRNTSDFYHSIPHSRLCILISFSLAVVSWVAVTIISTCTISSLVYAILSKYYIAVYSTLFKYAVGCFVASLLVISAILLAMSITGTLLTNIMLACLILFVPRICYYAFDAACANSLDILVQGHVLPLSGTGYNIVTDLFMSLGLGSNDYIGLFFNASGLIYTTLLAALYAVLAAIFFQKRKSEAAGNSAPSRRLQALYRCAVTMVICFIAVYVIVASRNSLDEGDMIGIVAIYIIAVLAYFVYELITTRKLKKLARAIPGLLVVALLNVALIGAGAITKNVALSWSPDADEIKGVEIVENDSRYYGNYDYLEYKKLVYGDYMMTDPEIKELVAKALSGNINCLKSGDKLWRKYYASETLKIYSAGGAKYRELWMTQEDSDKLNRMLFDNDDFRDDFTKLPEYSSLYFTSDFAHSILHDDNGGKELYECFKKELAKVSYDELYDHLREASYSDIMLEVTTLYKNKNLGFSIPVYGDLFPETYDRYLELVTEDIDNSVDEMNAKLAELWARLEEVKEDEVDKNSYGYINFYIFNENTNRYNNYYLFLDQSTDKADLNALLTEIKNLGRSATSDTLKYGNNFMTVDIYWDDPSVDDGYYRDGEDVYYVTTTESYYFVINLRDVDGDSITKIVDKFNGNSNGDTTAIPE